MAKSDIQDMNLLDFQLFSALVNLFHAQLMERIAKHVQPGETITIGELNRREAEANA